VAERDPSRKCFYRALLPTWASEPTVSHALSKSNVLGEEPAGNRARRVSAVRRLLPPPTEVSHQSVVLGSMRWVDVAGRALRRTWTAHGLRQYVEVLLLTTVLEKASPPPRPPRAVRSHSRWSWHDRLAYNARFRPPQLRITVAGVPSLLAVC
jgi:hypothetical protein